MLGFDERFPVQVEPHHLRFPGPTPSYRQTLGVGFSGAPQVTLLHTWSVEVFGNHVAHGCFPLGLRGAAQPLLDRQHELTESTFLAECLGGMVPGKRMGFKKPQPKPALLQYNLRKLLE